MAKQELYDKKVAAEKIQRWQRESGLMGKEIAKMIGVSAPYYSDIRKGKQRGSIPVLAKIANVLGRGIEDLLTEQKTEQNPVKITDLRKALRPLFKSETNDVIECVQLWRMAPRNFKVALRTLIDA
ncbi:MAG: helix-turn-helix transcriptional regulator [Candidatus Latescibacteria bacterium]|jgi:transcriptional regulator with XRE-family HTH domain|nr:helix-turn-helix transcriptional regulator [Candidatus Latescibacterota bacterium]